MFEFWSISLSKYCFCSIEKLFDIVDEPVILVIDDSALMGD